MVKAWRLMILLLAGCGADGALDRPATRVGECANESTCGAGADACALDRGLIESLCKPLDDGSCQVIERGAEMCDESCCVRLVCVLAGDECVPTVVDKE